MHTQTVVCIEIPAFCTATCPWCRQHVECPLQHGNFVCTWHYFSVFLGLSKFYLACLYYSIPLQWYWNKIMDV